MSWYDNLLNAPQQIGQYLTGTGQYDPTNADKASRDAQVGALNANAGIAQGYAGQAQGFANQAQGNYNNMTGQLGQTNDYLRGQMMGQNSVSALQLQQAAQQNMAQQRSMAASASPNNSAAAQRNAMLNSSRINTGLAGQQAVAGLAERNQAAGQLGNALLGQRGQDVNATLGGQSNANGALGVANQGYGAGLNAYANAIGGPRPTEGQQYLNAAASAAGLAAKSDRRAKTNITDADDDAKAALSKLGTYRYDYKDEKDGKGSQFGIMAQEMEKAGLGHAIINTKQGKYVDGAKAALSGLGLAAALARRVDKLESKGK